MKRIIVTGFEPFGPYSCNPVQESTKYFDGKKVGNYEVTGIVLRCTYLSAFETLRHAIEALKPVAIIQTGLSSSVQGIRFETLGKNIMNGKYPDADGSSPKGVPILINGPNSLSPNGDSSALASLLNTKGIPTEISEDAEAFVCNSLLYLTAHYNRQIDVSFRQIFFHTPWTDRFKNEIELTEGKIMIAQEMLHDSIEQLIRNVDT